MYTAYYNLTETPFNQAVDPKYTWLSKNHSEALLAIKKDFLDKKGLFSITGDAGTGKTSFIKRFLAEIDTDKIVVTVTDPDLDKLDFFNWLSAEFNLNVMFNSKGAFLTRFKRFLLDAYQKRIKIILIIDEAHRINQELLEEIIILSNIEKNGSKLISIFFIGQSGFNDVLQEKHNLSLRQSINFNYHLAPLQKHEVTELILYRLKVAGAKAEIFSSKAYDEIYLFSDGYPRMVINICDRALIAGCIRSTHIIDKELIIECGKGLQIAGIKRKIEGIDYNDTCQEPKVSAERAAKETKTETNKYSISGLITRIFANVQISIFSAVLVSLIILGSYFIYYFKPNLLSWASINLDQKKSASVLIEQPVSTTTQKSQNESEKNIVLSSSENEKSITTGEKPVEPSSDGYGNVDPNIDEKYISSDNKNGFSASESFDPPPVVEEFQDVIANNESSPIKSDTGTASPPTSGEKAPETISEEEGINIDQLPSQLSELGSEIDSTAREFKSLSRHLALKLKPLEKERQEADIKIVALEPETGKASVARPADDSKARKQVQLSQSGAEKLKPLEKERQEADIKIVALEPETEKVSLEQPARDSMAEKDFQSTQPVADERKSLEKERQEADIETVRLEPETEKVNDAQAAHDIKAGKDIQPFQSAVRKPPTQVPPVKSDLDPIIKPQRKPGIEIASLGQATSEDDLRSRRNLLERLQSFLEVYCQTYEAKDLDHFSTFFTPDAQENDKPFHSLLPKYRHNFNAIEFINYRIEIQKYKYDDENETVKIEGRFFLEWLPSGTKWRRNSGKIFMELHESGTSYKVSRLDYFGDRGKKTTDRPD